MLNNITASKCDFAAPCICDHKAKKTNTLLLTGIVTNLQFLYFTGSVYYEYSSLCTWRWWHWWWLFRNHPIL